MIDAFAQTHVGLVRANNEDSLCVNDTFLNRCSEATLTLNRCPVTLAVFDGMGGEEYGEVASGLGASILSSHSLLFERTAA